MKERGILMSAPMALATLKCTKTQTRRVTGLYEINKDPDCWTVAQQGLINLPGAPYTGRNGHVIFYLD